MDDYEDFKQKLPAYTIVSVEDLKKRYANDLSIRKKALPFEFPLDTRDKIDIALVMEKYSRQSFYSGLSAPQLGIMKRLIVFTIPRGETQDFCRTKVFLNPSYEKVDDEVIEDTECCVSVKGVVASVPRYSRIRCHAYDIKGTTIEMEVSGTTARLIQHEVDHLDGKLFVDLVSPDKIMSVSDFVGLCESKYMQMEESESLES